MLNILLHHMLGIFFQFCLSLILYIPFYKFFEIICTKGKPRNLKVSDVLIEGKMTAKIILLTGLALLGVTIIINIFYNPLIGFYLSSAFFLFLGSSAIFYPKGKRITKNCWVTLSERDDFIVTLNDHKILITGERLRGKPDHVIYKEISPKWLPPHEDEPVSEKDYEYMLKAILKFLEKLRQQGAIQGTGEHIGPYLTKEEIISEYARKGWKTERFPDGATKVSPPQRKNLLVHIINFLSRNNQR